MMLHFKFDLQKSRPTTYCSRI